MVSEVVGLLGYLPLESWKVSYTPVACYALGRAAKKRLKEGPPKPQPQVNPPRHD